MVKRNGAMDSLQSRFTQEWGTRVIDQCEDIEQLRKLAHDLWASNAMLKAMTGKMLISGISSRSCEGGLRLD